MGKKSFVAKSVPIVPISGWIGHNLIKPSENMKWWTGQEVENIEKTKVKVHTLLDAFNDMVVLPKRDAAKAMRTPVSGVYKIKGVGDVITGRVEQGTVSPGAQQIILENSSGRGGKADWCQDCAQEGRSSSGTKRGEEGAGP